MRKLKKIDINFNMYSDAQGGDPDTRSQTLNNYHFLLWNKLLPSGQVFNLERIGKSIFYLEYRSSFGVMKLSSDSIIHTYTNWKSMKQVVSKFDSKILDDFLNIGATIGGYIIFPAYRIEKHPTINGIRGMHSQIKDRFDLTLECIKRWYQGQDNPLNVHINRYRRFFELFIDFRGYVDFFLLKDLVDDTYNVKFWLPFDAFGVTNPLPTNPIEYKLYMYNVIDFLNRRNKRIMKWSETLNRSDNQGEIE